MVSLVRGRKIAAGGASRVRQHEQDRIIDVRRDRDPLKSYGCGGRHRSGQPGRSTERIFRQVRFHRRIPEAVGGAVLILGLVAILIGCVVTLVEPAQSWIEEGPARLREVGTKLYPIQEQIEEISKASDKVEETAGGKPDVTKQDAAPFPFAPDESPEEPSSDKAAKGKAWPDIRDPRWSAGVDRYYGVKQPIPKPDGDQKD